MIKKIALTIIVVCLLFSSFFNYMQISQAQNSPSISLVPPAVTATRASETFELTFKISDVTNLCLWNVEIAWDPQYLEMAKDPVNGGFYPEGTSIFLYAVNKMSTSKGIVNANGFATVHEAYIDGGKSGSGTLLILTFKVLKPVLSTEITVDVTALLAPDQDSVKPYPAVTSATTTVSYIPSDGTPVAHAGSNQTVNQFTTVTLDASQTIPKDDPSQTYTWTFTDNTTRTLTGKTVNYAFDWPGKIPVTLTVTNSKGTSDALIYIIVICTTPPVPLINIDGYSGQTINVPVNQLLVMNGSQSYDPSNLTLVGDPLWDFGDGQKAYKLSVGHAYSTSGTYIVSLTLTNSAGLNATATKTLVVGDGVLGPSSEGSEGSPRGGPNTSDRSQQNTLNLPPFVLYPLIFMTVFAMGGAAFWLRKKTDTSTSL
jgi:PKD repeat protein